MWKKLSQTQQSQRVKFCTSTPRHTKKIPTIMDSKAHQEEKRYKQQSNTCLLSKSDSKVNLRKPKDGLVTRITNEQFVSRV